MSQLYYMDDCRIAVPEGFRDLSVNALEWATEDGGRLTLMVQRQPLPAREGEATSDALRRYVEAQAELYAAQFVGFRLERDEETEESRFPMRSLVFRWQRDGEVLYNHQTFAVLHDVVVFTGTARARDREALDRLMNEALSELHARAD